MTRYNQILKRAKELIHDPAFQKPIPNTDYSKSGSVTLITNVSKLISYEKN